MTDVTEEIPEEAPKRDGKGWLLPGHHGLPGAGRPRGLSNADKMRLLLEPEREKLIGHLLKNALQSEDIPASNRAIEVALSRIAPVPKQDSERVEVPGLADAISFTEKCQAVIAAVANGEVSADAGERLLRLLDVFRKAHVTDELEQRINELQDELKAMNTPITLTVKSSNEGNDLI